MRALQSQPSSISSTLARITSSPSSWPAGVSGSSESSRSLENDVCSGGGRRDSFRWARDVDGVGAGAAPLEDGGASEDADGDGASRDDEDVDFVIGALG